MAQTTYTLAWILPYVREALKQTSNFEFRTYANALFSQLEKAQVQGVARFPQGANPGGQVFQYEAMPLELRALVSEAFYHLFHKGYISPEAPDAHLNSPRLHRFRVTQRGLAWFQGREPLPEDADKYMSFLRERVPTLDSVVEQYTSEALIAFEREALFAAAVMLGATSETALYLLAESMLDAFKDAKRRQNLQSSLDRRRLLELFELVRDSIDDASKSKALPYSQFEESTTHLMSLFEAARVQRNDAVHPMNATVSADSVRLLIESFPYALRKSEELREWFSTHPKSI